MSIFVVIRECWEEDPKLLIQTVLAGTLLATLGIVVVVLTLAM